MAKTENERLADRLAEIEDLLKKKAEIEFRLKILTGIKQEEKKAPINKPDGFKMTEAIEIAVKESNVPLTAPQITAAINAKYNISFAVRNIRSTAKYLVGRTLQFNEENKTFSLKEI